MGTAESAAQLDIHLAILLGIMIATGLLGGLANHFLNERENHAPWGGALRHLVLGTVAALTVPLFLNMMSSHLLEATRLNPNELFVFAGFCLIYVVVSRRFFDNLAAHLMHQVEQMRREMHPLQQADERAPAGAAFARPATADAGAQPAAVTEMPRNAVSYGDIELMRAIGEGNVIYGAHSTLGTKTSLPREQIATRLAALKALGLIESKIDERNVVRWHLTHKGRSLIDGISAAASLEEKRDTA